MPARIDQRPRGENAPQQPARRDAVPAPRFVPDPAQPPTAQSAPSSTAGAGSGSKSHSGQPSTEPGKDCLSMQRHGRGQEAVDDEYSGECPTEGDDVADRAPHRDEEPECPLRPLPGLQDASRNPDEEAPTGGRAEVVAHAGARQTEAAAAGGTASDLLQLAEELAPMAADDGVFEVFLPGGQKMGVVVSAQPALVRFLLSSPSDAFAGQLRRRQGELQNHVERRIQKNVDITVL